MASCWLAVLGVWVVVVVVVAQGAPMAVGPVPSWAFSLKQVSIIIVIIIIIILFFIINIFIWRLSSCLLKALYN